MVVYCISATQQGSMCVPVYWLALAIVIANGGKCDKLQNTVAGYMWLSEKKPA